MPVSPAISAGSHAPLGVAEKTFPWLSTTSTQVVSFTSTFETLPVGILMSKPGILPGRDSSDACAGSISLRRSAA